MSEITFENQQDEAFNRLRRCIISLDYAPGEKLGMKELCSTLEIGRTPIRGALQQLQKQGLVMSIPQSGTYVTKISMAAAENSRFVREIVEKEVVEECAALATRADIDTIDQAICHQKQTMELKQRRDFFITDNLMHQIMFTIARRSQVWDWLSTTNADLERFRLIRTLSPDLNLTQVYEQHLQLRDALERHDTTEARYLTAQHLHLMTHEAPQVIKLYPDYFM